MTTMENDHRPAHRGRPARPGARRPACGRRRGGPGGAHRARAAGEHPDHRRRAVHGARGRSGRRGGRRCRSGTGVYGLAHHPGPGARRPGGPARRAAHRAQGRPRHAGDDRGGQDHLRGTRRGAGDDRHLRVRGRSVAAAVRQDHRLRAPRSPPDGNLAPARCRRRHHRVQLPGRGVGVEHRRRPGVRRHRGLEAVGPDAVDRDRLPGPDRARRHRRRRATRRSAG